MFWNARSRRCNESTAGVRATKHRNRGNRSVHFTLLLQCFATPTELTDMTIAVQLELCALRGGGGPS